MCSKDTGRGNPPQSTNLLQSGRRKRDRHESLTTQKIAPLAEAGQGPAELACRKRNGRFLYAPLRVWLAWVPRSLDSQRKVMLQGPAEPLHATMAGTLPLSSPVETHGDCGNLHTPNILSTSFPNTYPFPRNNKTYQGRKTLHQGSKGQIPNTRGQWPQGLARQP